MGNIKRLDTIQVGRDAPINENVLWLDISSNLLALKHKYNGVWTSCNSLTSINWGNIGGNIVSQNDLINLLNTKAPKTLSIAGKILVTNSDKEIAVSDINASKLQTLDNLGTASVKDVPISGDASDAEVVLGNDTRLKKFLSGYTKGTDSSDIVSADTINQAFSKVENKIDKVKAADLKTLSFKFNNTVSPNLKYYKIENGETTQLEDTEVFNEVPTTDRFILSYRGNREEAQLINLNCVKYNNKYYLSSIAEGQFFASLNSGFNLFKIEITATAPTLTVKELNIE